MTKHKRGEKKKKTGNELNETAQGVWKQFYNHQKYGIIN